MIGLTSRLYTEKDTPQLLVDLIAAVRPPDWIADYPGSIDLRELLSLPAMQANTRLWFDPQQQLVAFALVDPYNNLLCDYLPALSSPEFEKELVGWGVECLLHKPREVDEPLTLDASCREENVGRIGLLERNGFVHQPIQSLSLARSLNEPIPQPFLPPGFTIRPFKGQEEIEEWVALHCAAHSAAHGSAHMTVDERRAMMSGLDYDPQMDLVVVAPDGRLAAYGMGQIDGEENARSGRRDGWADPFATHPDFQRLGLARALVLTVLRLLKDHGMETALMGTSSENLHMQSVAYTAGFQVQSNRIWFSKAIVETVE